MPVTQRSNPKMSLMLGTETIMLFSISEFVDLFTPFAIIAIFILAVCLVYFRQGRNLALEKQLVEPRFGPPQAFHGTLTVVDHQPGRFLRLTKSTDENRSLQFKYRWLSAGPQATFDEVTFDGSQGIVEMKRKEKCTRTPFSEFSAIRMQEVSWSRHVGTIWHVELVPLKGRPKPFITSEQGDRRMIFENAATIAKAVSAIMAMPVQACVAGNVWTPGWPPRIPAASKPNRPINSAPM